MTEEKENNIVSVPERNNVPVVNEAQAMLNMIAEAAVNPQVDIVKLEKLMELQERYLNREAATAYARDYALMRSELPKVIRNTWNEQTKKNYAELGDINEQIDPILSKYGFGSSTKIVSQTATHITVRAILLHKGGHSDSNDITMPLDDAGMNGTKNKTTVQAIASSTMYARRVATCALLNISTGDDKDGNANNNPEVDDALKKAVEACKTLPELNNLWSARKPTGANIKLFTAKKAALSKPATTNQQVK